MSDQQGTGKHPHKSTEEPYPHHESGRSGEQRTSGGESNRKESSSEKEGLKEREYRDNKGEIHHHTRTYEEQHK